MTWRGLCARLPMLELTKGEKELDQSKMQKVINDIQKGKNSVFL